MQIGAVGFQPYLYHAGGLSSRSLEAVKSLPEDALAGGTDFSELVSENENPLRRGETRGFMDILGMQMQLGAYHAARLMPETVSVETDALTAEELAEIAPDMDGDAVGGNRADQVDTETADKARALRNVSETVDDVNTTSTVQGTGEENDAGMYARTGSMAEITPFQVNRALDAYTAWMSA